MTKLYHFTRLLEQEVKDIRTNGLQPLSYDLIANKLHILGQNELAKKLSDIEYDFDIRLDQICFVARSFEDLVDQEEVELFITKWGGEVLHDLNDIHSFGLAYSRAVSESKAYEISIDIENAEGVDVYEGFANVPLKKIIIDPDKEYQIKRTIPSALLTIRELSNIEDTTKKTDSD